VQTGLETAVHAGEAILAFFRLRTSGSK